MTAALINNLKSLESFMIYLARRMHWAGGFMSLEDRMGLCVTNAHLPRLVGDR